MSSKASVTPSIADPDLFAECPTVSVANADPPANSFVNHGLSVTYVCKSGYNANVGEKMTRACNDGVLDTNPIVCNLSKSYFYFYLTFSVRVAPIFTTKGLPI